MMSRSLARKVARKYNRAVVEPGPARPDPRGFALVQPAATLVAHGLMSSVRMMHGTTYRGLFYIYAPILYNQFNRAVCNSGPYRSALVGLGYGRANPLPLMRIVGRAVLADCACVDREIDDDEVTDKIGSYSIMFGRDWLLRYDWRFEGARFVPSPIPLADRAPTAGFFRIDPEIAARVDDAAQDAGHGPRVIDVPAPRATILEEGFRIVEMKK